MLHGQHALLEFISSAEVAWEIKVSLIEVFEAASFASKLPETNVGRNKLHTQWKLIRLIEDIESQFKIIEEREKQKYTHN